MALGCPKMVRATKEGSTEALGAGRTARKASRRPGRTPKYRTARGTAYFSTLLATFGVVLEARPEVFGRPNQGTAGKQCGGLETNQDSEEGVQEARKDCLQHAL